MRTLTEEIRHEFLRQKTLAERAIGQLTDADLVASPPNWGNSIAALLQHISGNLQSRFTDFLTSDGEKPWRHREEEFEAAGVTRAELLAHWERGWTILLDTLSDLKDEQFQDRVTVRGDTHTVHEALLRALAHMAQHVGQIVFAAKSIRGKDWEFLSIPPGQSDAFNRRR